MSEENNVNVNDKDDQNKTQNVNTDDKNVHMIPKSRFDQVVQQRKDAEKALDEIATELIEEIPEDFRDIIPDLPPAKKIKWLNAAKKKGLFDSKSTESIDSKRPGDKSPTNFEGMSPQAIMATGYNK